ncbi:MAG: hypothetical protein NT016_03780 [Candidatus Aenigmarchaeota archaeon]|nr:hypothetical protein [Candidatus Aenigmarchaeota archaeon]
MKGVLLVLAAVVAIAALSGCVQQPAPVALLEISTNSIQVRDNQTSDIVTVTVTKNDDKEVPMAFVVALMSSNSDYVYPVAVTGAGARITAVTTQPLRDKGASDTVQFKLFGRLPAGVQAATFNITASLYYNNSLVPGVKPLVLNAQVTQ